jgi:putative aldouronate transport system permease protein
MLYLMLLPAVLMVAIFHYGPIYGLQIAFKNYSIGLGIWDSPWAGLEYFRRFVSTPAALLALRNTLIISLLNLSFGFPMPIIFALVLNEINRQAYKRVAQTISYLPHFISWIIVAGIINNLLSPSTGLFNSIITGLGGKAVYFLADPAWFRPILVISNIWKGVGWGSVVYLAALSGIDPTYYEAAIVDGASRLQRIRYITLPNLLPIAAIMLILSLGGIMNAGFDQVFNLYNPQIYEVGDILDTYVYRKGLVEMSYSFSSAVGFFKSVVGFILVITVNQIVKKLNGERQGMLF